MKNMIAGVCALLMLSACAAPTTAPAGGTSTSQLKVDDEGSTGSNIKKRPKKAAEVVSVSTTNRSA
ncbi:hypothetical protein IGS59_00300 [Janthinobacterium sp. GW460P]|uniref:hypothetical protein n=1 Tax=unclassified Janthinobacterium TaxID=2610881 RepID=UPI00111C7E5E|nr:MULTISPECIES: hypothetical protein [unclassified Janthinobacterium]MCC7700662.1 hypothetical protein [Janthinobacterium sp. GW460P]MCC7706169.1 hypothetical protein [Janthinobacterium sp. GW460W]